MKLHLKPQVIGLLCSFNCPTLFNKLFAGREAQIDKRREVGARTHGAANDRDAGRDGLEVSSVVATSSRHETN